MIGVFDSGLGGLTVLKEIRRVLPEYDYLYLGDTLHVPYGNRSDKAVYDLTRNACEYLFSRGCKLIILACNTATAKALRRLQQEYLPKRKSRGNENILGVVRPIVEYVKELDRKNIGVIGTRGTVNSCSYMVELKKGQGSSPNPKNKVKKDKQEIQVFQQACPLLVPMIEEGWQKSKEMRSILQYYLRPLRKARINLLVLGCTHYPLLLSQIKKIIGKSSLVPNPGAIVARSLKDYLLRHKEIRSQLKKTAKVEYLVTDLNENFQSLARKFIGKNIKIKLVKY